LNTPDKIPVLVDAIRRNLKKNTCHASQCRDIPFVSLKMFEPVRGGTRGGQAEFKWSDVSADKDREVSNATALDNLANLN
jgi:hypothetical protein